MKTRILAAAVLIALLGGLVCLGLLVTPFFITALIILLTVLATYELLHTALKVKYNSAVAVACTFGGLFALLNSFEYLDYLRFCLSFHISPNKTVAAFLSRVLAVGNTTLAVAFFVFAVAFVLIKQADFSLEQVFGLIAAPRILAFGFSRIGAILTKRNIGELIPDTKTRIYYLLLMLCFSCVCDTGAYFVGVKCGKHKLCPEISPKKTVEGAVGGIISTVIAVIILMVAFGKTEHIIATALITVPMCILGIMGDLFASIIKRKSGIKDYGNLIPGHGGVLDRFDSTLLIAPALYIFIYYGVI